MTLCSWAMTSRVCLKNELYLLFLFEVRAGLFWVDSTTLTPSKRWNKAVRGVGATEGRF